MSTKRLISDQILYRLNGGSPDNSFPVQLPDVYKALEQKVNAKFQIRQFDTNLPQGETIPDNLCIGVYENITVEPFTQLKSKATLPVMPITLPKNVGIFLIYDQNHIDNPFIPLQRGTTALLKTNVLLNDLMGLVSYEPRGREVIFNKNLPQAGVTKVTMELIVMDISQYSETDILPIPASLEAEIIEELVQQFSKIVPDLGIVNNYSNAQQKANP